MDILFVANFALPLVIYLAVGGLVPVVAVLFERQAIARRSFEDVETGNPPLCGSSIPRLAGG